MHRVTTAWEDLRVSTPMLRELSPEAYDAVYSVFSMQLAKTHEPGELLIKLGEESDNLHFLLEGVCEGAPCSFPPNGCRPVSVPLNPKTGVPFLSLMMLPRPSALQCTLMRV